MERIEDNQVLEDNLSYQAIKNVIKGKLNSVAESFVSIGYRLKQVRDRELYKQDGYKDIYEFALKEYNIEKSNTSRFMNINDKFSVNGNSPFLIPEYAGYGSSKLSEMLNMDEEDLKFISEKATVTEIREVKQLKKEATQNGVVATSQQNPESPDSSQSKSDFTTVQNKDISKLIKVVIKHFQDKNKRNSFKELISLINKSLPEEQLNQEAAIIINPSKHFLFKDGFTMAFFEENIIKYKEFGGKNIEYTYCDFLQGMEETYNLESADPWIEYYGEPEPEEKKTPEPESKKPEPKKPEPKKTVNTKPEAKEQPEQQETREESDNTEEDTEEDTEGDTEKDNKQIHIDSYPEYAPEEKEVEKVAGEIINSIEETSQPEQEPEEEEPTTHDLKTDHIYFEDVIRGIKLFELRKNDRDYQVGDILRLNECIDGAATGCMTTRRVIYLLQDYPGLEDGYCILGITED